jgi:hypothetical protein
MQILNPNAPMRLIIIANAPIPTLQLSLLIPLSQLIKDGECCVSILTEQDVKTRFDRDMDGEDAWEWIRIQFINLNPTHLIFCRYSGPHAERILRFVAATKISTIYVIDDDLLNVPMELGEKKYNYHNHPLRLGTVQLLLNNVDVVYCSNDRLKNRLNNMGFFRELYSGEIFCAGHIINDAQCRPVEVIGYMGIDHAHDFEIVLPALINILIKYHHLKFELFGKIPKPSVLDQFGSRVSIVPMVPDYSDFLLRLAERQWDIGICPLTASDFNQVKNINKWIEYTSVGAAVVASRGMIYDECCANGCGYLANDEDWENALSDLIENPHKRFEQVVAAQIKLANEYTISRLSAQLISILKTAESTRRSDY